MSAAVESPEGDIYEQLFDLRNVTVEYSGRFRNHKGLLLGIRATLDSYCVCKTGVKHFH